MNLLDAVALGGKKALEDCGVLRVHRKYDSAVLPHSGGHYASGGDQGLFVRQGYNLAFFKCGKGGLESAESDHRPNYDVNPVRLHQGAEAVHPGPYLGVGVLESLRNCRVAGLLAYHYVGRIEAPCLLNQQVGASPCCKYFNFKQIRVLGNDIQRLGPYGTCGSEYRYFPFH